MPTALVVDDSMLIRAQLRQFLAPIGVQVVAEGTTGNQLLPLYEQHKPDLVLLDIVMPGKDGVTAAAELLAAHPEAHVVICSSLNSREKILACQRAGVRHYILKPFDAEKVQKVCEFVLKLAIARASGGSQTGAPQ
jgi:DNA-binding NarL/FixJ family response regulator